MASSSSGTQKYFDHYGSFQDYIGNLSTPKPGYIRVFRGQCRDYGNVRPTGVRVPLRNEQIWLQYCRMLATDILAQQGVPVESALSSGRLWGYWYYAIVQHYGPGTQLLDVSHSLEVALWFALHRASVGPQIKFGYLNSRQTSPFPNLCREDDWTSYHNWTESPGALYIFDVQPWAATERPRHGELVDLALGPEFFANSARIQAQKGCLIAADPDNNEGDLTQFLAHPPIRVAWPMTGCVGASLPTPTLFPGPKEDEWYARLLFLPVVPQVSRTAPYWRMAHPVPLSMYIEHLESARYAIAFNPLQPTLLYPWLITAALLANPPSQEAYDQAARYLRSIPILLEAPLVAMQPDHDHTSWNHALLTENLPRMVVALEWESGEMSEMPVLLRDVLFELSPLECVGWTDLLRQGEPVQVPRAIHLVRDNSLSWQLQVFFQRAPKEQVEILFEEATSVRFDQVSQRFQLHESGEWADICTNPIAAKSFLVALSLLRTLAPDPNSPRPMEAYRTASAVLARTPDLFAGIPYYVMRDTKTNEPYFTGDCDES
jgi:hypothetical protein